METNSHLVKITENENIVSYISNQESPYKEIYISVDIEADGPTPLDGNMISLAAIATDLSLNILGLFEANLQPHIEPNPVVIDEFWSKYPQQYNRTKVHAVDPKDGMPEFIKWMKQAGKDKHLISMMALPIAYEKMFIQPYAVKFGGKPRGAFDGVGGIDIESLIMMYKKIAYRDIDHTLDVPEFRQPNLNLTHNAIEDSLDQMVIGVNLLRHSRKLEPKFLEQKVITEILGISNSNFGELSSKVCDKQNKAEQGQSKIDQIEQELSSYLQTLTIESITTRSELGQYIQDTANRDIRDSSKFPLFNALINQDGFEEPQNLALREQLFEITNKIAREFIEKKSEKFSK